MDTQETENAPNKESFYTFCKTDSILSHFSNEELQALKPYWQCLQEIATLPYKAAFCTSVLQGLESATFSTHSLESMQLHSAQNLESLHDQDSIQNLEFTQATKALHLPQHYEAFSLYFYNEKKANKPQQSALQTITQNLKPWRKGPFCLYFMPRDNAKKATHFYIDSEWQSNKKMRLILNALENLNYDIKGKEILDVGCNNGYYMFDLALRGADCVMGIDPIAIFFMQFYFIAKLSTIPHCFFRLLGVQDIAKLGKKYDLILCLGVLYHRKEPLQTLRLLKSAKKKNGIVLLETLIIQSEMPLTLCPYPTYAKMKNVYYIFSPKALENLALHAGFQSCELLGFSYTDSTEQRTTEFIQTKSLGDFLQKDSTTEGYPPACRGIFVLQ